MAGTGRSVDGASPPSVFVGSFGYPKLTIGPLTSPTPVPIPERLERSDFLYERSIGDIYSIRSSLVRGKYKVDVGTAGNTGPKGSAPLYDIEPKMQIRGRKILDSVQELSLSSRHIETEMKLTRDLRKIEPVSVDAITMPMGPSVDLRSVSLHENAKVPAAVERSSSDDDVTASVATVEMYDSGIPTDHLVRLLSVGMMGEGRRRRLVPTRWSITAVDDTLSLDKKEKVLELPPLDRYLLYEGERFGNHFLIAFFPPPFRFEMMEQWQQGSLWGEGDVIIDHEGPRGRKNYASKITGAYYAARLSALEHLEMIRRCGGISVIRWITEEYWAPLGVWVIRETVRRALKGEALEFEDMGSLVRTVDRKCGMKGWKKKTKYLNNREDTSLDRFL